MDRVVKVGALGPPAVEEGEGGHLQSVPELGPADGDGFADGAW